MVDSDCKSNYSNRKSMAVTPASLANLVISCNDFFFSL
jgi:hypothetical protein